MCGCKIAKFVLIWYVMTHSMVTIYIPTEVLYTKAAGITR